MGDLIAQTLELESLWPDWKAYARLLFQIAEALEEPKQAQAIQDSLLQLLLPKIGLRGQAGDQWWETRWDALADFVADVEGLQRFFRNQAQRATQRRGRANLLSLMRRQIIWRAQDALRRRRRHQRRVQERPQAFDAQSRILAQLMVQQLLEQFQEDERVEGVISALLSGESVSEVSRRTGLSRPAIYRLLARIRDWLKEI